MRSRHMNLDARSARYALALDLAGGSHERAEAIARTGLLDVALDGRQAVFGERRHGNTGKMIGAQRLAERRAAKAVQP